MNVVHRLEDLNPEFPLPEFAEDFIQALLRVYHIDILNVENMLWKMIIDK